VAPPPGTRHGISLRCVRVRREGSGAGWVAGRRYRCLAVVLDFDVDPGSVGSRVPDFLEGTGHRATDAASPTAVRQPHQPGHDRREARRDGDLGQKVGHLSRVTPDRGADQRRHEHPVGPFTGDAQPMVALPASASYSDVQPNVAEGGETMEIRGVESPPVTQVVAAR